ncbi:hypothetical protein D3C72_809260 [compost metagenome]
MFKSICFTARFKFPKRMPELSLESLLSYKISILDKVILFNANLKSGRFEIVSAVLTETSAIFSTTS